LRSRLRAGESVAAVVRRHWIVLAGPMALVLFLLGGLAAAWFVHRPHVLPAVAALFGVAVAWAFWRWLDWHCDLWAVTSQRVIDEEGVLAVRVVDSPLDTIHNVTCEQSLLGRMLRYGTLNIQTAAEHGSTTIVDVTRPEDLRETILELQQRYKYGGAASAAKSAAGATEGRRPGAERGAVAGAGGADGGAEAWGETRDCPYCAETIKAKAKVCRFCGRTL